MIIGIVSIIYLLVLSLEIEKESKVENLILKKISKTKKIKNAISSFLFLIICFTPIVNFITILILITNEEYIKNKIKKECYIKKGELKDNEF